MKSTTPDSVPDGAPGQASRPRDFVQSLERGLAIISVFDADRPAMTTSEVAQLTGLTRAAVRRFLLTLGELGYVTMKANRYELTPRVLELGYAYLSALSFPEIALPRLEQLSADTGEASEGAVLDRRDIVYMLRVPGPSLMTMSVTVGARRPAYATAMGRVLLADLEPRALDEYLDTYPLSPVLPGTLTDANVLRGELAKVRRDGYAVVNQELEEGLIAIAAPVRDRRGQARAAINLSTHVGRRSLRELRNLAPEIIAAARDIERSLLNSVSWSE